MNRLRLLWASGLLVAFAPGALFGQNVGVRGWAQSNLRFVEMRPFVADTAGPTDMVLGGDGRVRVDGRVVQCEATQPECIYWRPDLVTDAWVGSQDVGFTAWGFGVQGLSFTGLVRAREQFSGELAWPLADDAFDVMVGYAQLDRGRLRARVGRQQNLSGLGFSGFDGGLVRFQDVSWWVEGFGGRSLARGLNETRNEALRGIEDFVPQQDAWLFGGSAGVRLGLTDVTARYQREIISDRSHLLSERASLDATSVLPWGVRVRGSVDYDLPFARVGKAHLTLQRALLSGRLLAELEGRRYVPYFDLSTIWGFFSPVPYHEVRTRMSLGLGRLNGVTVALAARDYGDPGTTVVFDALEDFGWQAEVGGFWAPTERVRLEGAWQLDWAAAAWLNSFDAAVRLQLIPDVAIRLHGTSFQQFEAFRTGDHRAIGGGASLDWEVLPGTHVDGGWTVMRQGSGFGGDEDVWNQTRGWFGLRWDFGGDPGLRRTR